MEQTKGYVRRIVTGHDEHGQSIVTEDCAAPAVHTNPKRVGFYCTNLWITHETPAVVNNGPDPTTGPMVLEPPKSGSVVRIIEFGPEGDWTKQLGSEGAKAAGASKLAEGVATVSAKTKDNKDYTGFILSKLAEIVAEKESAGNTNIDNLLMMGIEADIPTLQDLYKKGYLKIPESYFTGGGNNKTAIIESLLDLFDISDAEKATLRIRLEKASIEKLKTTLAQRRQKAGLPRARKQTRKRQIRKRQTRKN